MAAEAAIAFALVGWIAREGSDDKLGIRLIARKGWILFRAARPARPPVRPNSTHIERLGIRPPARPPIKAARPPE